MTTISFIVMLLFCSGAALTIHETGHYLAARFFGHHLVFVFKWGVKPLTFMGKTFVIRIPRLTADMPDIELWKKRVIAASGFGSEFLASVALIRFDREILAIYLIVCFAHLIIYKYYCGDNNDFSYFSSLKEVANNDPGKG